MPLHLLGKKSWNVYNPESIARVRQDEATAKRQDAEEERRVRNNANAQRLERLRSGDTDKALDDLDAQESFVLPEVEDRRKRRRLPGENDTDRGLREAGERAPPNIISSHLAPHIPSRLAAGPARDGSGQNNHAQEGMRFVDAVGTKSGTLKPWYTERDHDMTGHTVHTVSYDRWGNEDPRRRQREQQRLDKSDPLTAMKRGVKQLRENEKQRKDWILQREQDLKGVEELARKYARKKRPHSDEESLEGFRLDRSTQLKQEQHTEPRKRHHHRRSRHRQRDTRSHRSRSPTISSRRRHEERTHERSDNY